MKKKAIPVIIILILILILGAILVVPGLIERYSYSRERADLSAYFSLTSAEDAAVLVNHEVTGADARVYDGVFYLEFSAVQDLINDRFYDGREDGILVYTTPQAVITAPVGGSAWTGSDGTSGDEGYVIARYEGEQLFVALDYVRRFTNFLYEGYVAPNRIALHVADESAPSASIKKDTALRERGGVKSPIVEDLRAGDTVIILEEMETWTKVATMNAFIGYVENKRLTPGAEQTVTMPADIPEEVFPSAFRPYKICMAWHNVAGAAGNDTLRELVEGTRHLNTVSPTWMALSADDGSIRSFASAAYVREAHDMGLDVWALVSDIDFKDTISNYQILSHAESRAALIRNLMQEAEATGFDGINVDFEFINDETAESYIQFLRELSLACHARDLVLSVDNYVPKEFNKHYHRAEQGVICDYVIIMGYDEHGTFSTEAGSVASIGYVTDGIERTLQEVPAEKVINGIPFYTRIWTTENGTLTSQAVGMRQAADFVSNHGIQLNWDDITCQNYGEKQEGSKFHQVWMEDDESIAAKLSAMQHHGLAGVAAWKLGFDTPSVWDTIGAYLAQ